nr:EAL domain-containing protein [Klebsiella quasipneumoniae]
MNGKTGEIYGVEILARWPNTTAQWRSPAEFIPLAERTGLIIPLTCSLMAQVAAQMRPIFSKLPDGFHIGHCLPLHQTITVEIQQMAVMIGPCQHLMQRRKQLAIG